jgi:fucose permease
VRSQGRRRLAAATLPIALLALATLGLRDGSLGVAWPSMRTTFHQPLSSLGVLLLLANAGYLVSSTASGWASSRIGTGSLLTAASVAATAALAVYALGRWWPLLLVAAPVLGLANGVIDTGVNAHVALHHNVRAMGLIHASYGVGATIGPILVTALVGGGAGWQVAFVVLLVLEAGLAARLWMTRPSWSTRPTEAVSTPAAEAEQVSADHASAVPRRALLPLSLAVFFLYTGVELATGAWAYSLLRLGRRYGAGAAGAWVASYWAALTAGRLLLGLAGHRVPQDRLLRWSAVAALAGAVMLWWNPWRWTGAAGLPVLGLGLAAMFPTLVSLTPARHGADRAHAVIGYQLAAAGVGGAALAALAGLIAGHLGLAAIAPYLALGAFALAALVELTAVAARQPKSRPGTKM